MLKPVSQWIVIFSLCMSISACNLLIKNADQQSSAANLKTVSDEGCSELLNYYDTVAAMPEEMRIQELDHLRNSSQLEKECHELKLAILLTQPGANLQNYEDACQMLENFITNETDADLENKQLARILLTHVKQSKKLISKQHSLQAQLRKERAAGVGLAKKLSELQLQLDQLRDIEKNINEKEQTITVPSIDNNRHESK